MFGFSRRRRYDTRYDNDTTGVTTDEYDTRTPRHHRGLFHSHRRAPERRAAGLKGALANPNTTATGRREAKRELHAMGRSAHVPLSVKIKRTLGIRSTPRRQRVARERGVGRERGVAREREAYY